MPRTLEDVRAEAQQNIERLNDCSRQWEAAMLLARTFGIWSDEVIQDKTAAFYRQWNHCCWLMVPVVALLPDLELPPCCPPVPDDSHHEKSGAVSDG